MTPFRLCNKEFIFFDAVKRNKRNHNRYALNVFLIFGVVAVAFILTNLKSAGTAEHNVDDADIADKSNNPLTDACENINT